MSTPHLSAIRTQHTLLLLELLWQSGRARVDISRELGLSRSAISSIVAELIDTGLVQEVGTRESGNTGRRATMLAFRERAAYLLAIDLGAQHLRVGLLDLRCHTLASRSVAHDIQAGPPAVYALIEELTEGVLQAANVGREAVALVGVGIPGPVDQATGCVVQPPNMAGWDGENVQQALEQRLGVGVRVDNDANLGALAETHFGPHQGTRDLVYVKAATGIGAGIVLGGRVHRGVRGGAGEIGHISINEQGPKGRSGTPGSLESYAAAGVLETLAEQLRVAGLPTALPPRPTADQLVELASTDPLARQVWQEAGHHLGVAIGTLLNLFNPAAVVIGGRMAGAGEVFLNAIRESALSRTLRINAQQTRIELSTLGGGAGILGAGALVLGELLTPSGFPLLSRIASASVHEADIRGPPLLVASHSASTGAAQAGLPAKPTQNKLSLPIGGTS